MNDYIGTASYSPEDNKLRLYPFARLPRDLYDRVKAAGFSWAPKQELFVASMWTPGREDLLLELCGEVGDEDKTLVERAEERSERFEEYSDKRAADADGAHKAVAAICDQIPMGQPILIGHHSEKHARRDAERIENGMRKAVKMWETSKYWTDRAASAVSHAKYKERPDVRARRIKGIEADLRKNARSKAESEKALRFWRGEMKLRNPAGEVSILPITEESRAAIKDICGGVLGIVVGNFYVVKKDQAQGHGGWGPWDVLKPDGERYAACPSCTVEQCRLAAEQAFTRHVAHTDRWLAHYENRLSYERAMLAADGGTATDKTGPEKGGAVRCWASHRGGWSYIVKVNRVSVSVLDNWGNAGDMDGSRNFTRTMPFDKLLAVMTAAEVEAARAEKRLVEYHDKTGFSLIDSTPQPAKDEQPKAPDQGEKFEALKDALRVGVQVVSAPQLFPTPPDLARRMVELAEIRDCHRVLEPSAGTGNLLVAIGNGPDKVAVEVSLPLVQGLMHRGVPGLKIVEADFLECGAELGKFDRVVMNPPFADGADVKHIRHAAEMLKPGGRMVAICAGGPRQKAALEPLAELWEPLPPDTFKEQGTSVNTVLLVIENHEQPLPCEGAAQPELHLGI